MLKLGISGVCGKMGKRIAVLASGMNDITVAAALEFGGHPEIGEDIGAGLEIEDTGIKISSDLEKHCRDIDCLIEFSSPQATAEHLEICRNNGVPIVIGTTGISPETEDKIKEASAIIPVVYSPNMAVGVNLLFELVRRSAKVLGKNFDISVDETHHVHKKDSPSGTAKMIAKVISEETGNKDIPIEAFREGEVIGNHGIIFDGEYEVLELRHEAKSRDVFAAGAIEAARFAAFRSFGSFDMGDVLGLKD